jgi:hypothetical protein
MNSSEDNLKLIITILNIEINDLRQAFESLKNATKQESAQKGKLNSYKLLKNIKFLKWSFQSQKVHLHREF